MCMYAVGTVYVINMCMYVCTLVCACVSAVHLCALQSVLA